ncbi:MAG: acetyl-CoA carboxyl transferase [Actinobacteria bacterium 13_1_20CM_3_71_11]|nr:MAG: acetyl-CoA carboxyl transferase [Actinobacteria bacterium 13_1_20CM_3_71_11]
MSGRSRSGRSGHGHDWVRCPGCRDLIYLKRFERSLRVCPGCGRHDRVSAPERIGQLLDPGSVRPIGVASTVEDPLSFVDRAPYAERLRDTRAKTGLDEAITCVHGTIDGETVVLAVMDFAFFGGSLGVAVGERIEAAARTARALRAPLVVVTASGGARMQEGALALMQMVKTTQALVDLDDAGLLTITVVTDPTYGGVAASYATQTDIIIAEPGAHLGLAGPRVIEHTIGEKLPAGFQTAEFLAERGLIDAVVPRSALRPLLGHLVATVRDAGPAKPGPRLRAVHETATPAGRDPWQTVALARHIDRPTTVDYARLMLDGFWELHGDRQGGDCPSIVGGLGRLGNRPVMLIGHQKGHSTRELVERNFGMPTPAGYRKAGRLMRLAAKLRVPVVTLIDTPGAFPGVDAERDGQAWAISANLRLMSTLPVPVVAVVTGEGGSGGALALGVADRVLALENAVYSVISPEGCAAILWRDSAAAPVAARQLQLDPPALLRRGVIDGVVAEPAGGAQENHLAAATAVKAAVLDALGELDGTGPELLLAARRRRYAGFGLEPFAESEEAA